jgi:hypothetical protein
LVPLRVKEAFSPTKVFIQENAMKSFIDKHTEKISGSLSCFDRVLFKGYLPIRDGRAMEGFMNRQGLLLKDFKKFVTSCSDAVKSYARTVAEDTGRPLIHLTWAIRKEEEARRMAERDNVTEGLVCIFSRVEQCQSFKLVYGKDKPRLVSAKPRCLCLYYYFMDRQFASRPGSPSWCRSTSTGTNGWPGRWTETASTMTKSRMPSST